MSTAAEMAKIISIETSTDLCSVALSDNDRLLAYRESRTPRAHASLTGLFNRNKFNLDVQKLEKEPLSRLGVAAIDLNGLKPINDRMGHSAGDSLIRSTANHIIGMFAGECYRIGGDEFAVIDTKLDEEAFRNAVAAAKQNMEQDGISVSVGVSWRGVDCSIKEQLDEADRQMYRAKAEFYSSRDHDRRKRGQP